MEKRSLRFFLLHSLAQQIQHLADYMSKQAREEERRLALRQPSPLFEAEREDIDTSGPPPHWLARVQKDAPELLKGSNTTSRENTPVFPTPASTQTEDHAPQTNPMSEPVSPPLAFSPWRARKTRTVEPTAQTNEKRLSPLENQQKGNTPPSLTRTPFPSQPDPLPGPTPATDGEEEQEPFAKAGAESNTATRKPLTSQPTGSFPLNRNQAITKNASPTPSEQVAATGKQSHDPAVPIAQRWPATHAPAATHTAQVQARTDPQEAHWPSLPDAEPASDWNQEWEMVRRVWERRQRLDKEQRGSSWNA